MKNPFKQNVIFLNDEKLFSPRSWDIFTDYDFSLLLAADANGMLVCYSYKGELE